jgi:hypothetical protein
MEYDVGCDAPKSPSGKGDAYESKRIPCKAKVFGGALTTKRTVRR